MHVPKMGRAKSCSNFTASMYMFPASNVTKQVTVFLMCHTWFYSVGYTSALSLGIH